MKTVNYEDMIMKKAMNIFADEGLKFFGILRKSKRNSTYRNSCIRN